MIDAHLYAFLTSNTELSAFVGDRVYPMRLPSTSAQDSIVYDVNAGFPDRRAVMTTHYVTLNIYSPDYDRMRSISDLLVAIFQSYHGNIGSLSVASCGVQVSINDFQEDANLYRNILTINITTN